jgi:hypothetical protein
MTALLIVLVIWVVASVPLGIACGAFLTRRGPSFRVPADTSRLRPGPPHEEFPCPRTTRTTPLPLR